MARFAVRKTVFGRRPLDDEDNGEGLPTPARIRLAARRAAGIKEASEVLAHLPGPGESLHAICTARMDLTDLVSALLERLGRCNQMAIATLGYNRKNLKSLLTWLDSKTVGSTVLVASIFFRSHKPDLWRETQEEFRSRGQRAATCHSHCKVVAMAFADGTRLSLEGSANLCGNGSGREQIAIVNDASLHDWHARWINDLVSRHETDQGPD